LNLNQKTTTMRMLKKSAVLSLIVAFNANAAMVFEHALKIDADTTYHTNFQLIDVDEAEETAVRYALRPQYQLKALDGQDAIGAVVGVNVVRSSDARIVRDREDPFAKLRWQRELESGLLGLSFDYVKDSARISQLRETGLVIEDSTQIQKLTALNWKHYLSDKLTANVGGEYEKSRFEEAQALQNFKRKTFKLGFSYALNETVTPYARVAANEVDFEEVGEIKFQTYMAGTKVTVNPNVNFSIGVGNAHDTNSGENDTIGELIANFRQRRGALNIKLTRTVDALDVGALQVLDLFETNYNYDWSVQDRIGMALEASQTNDGYEAQALTAYYRHQFNQAWFFGFNAGYSNVKQQQLDSADNKYTGFTLSYNSPNFIKF